MIQEAAAANRINKKTVVVRMVNGSPMWNYFLSAVGSPRLADAAAEDKMTGMPSVARQRGSLIGLAIGDGIGVAVAGERAGMQPWNPQNAGT